MPVIPNPRIAVPNFVQVSVGTTVDDMLGAIFFPSIANWLANSRWRIGQLTDRIVAPLSSTAPYFVDLVIHTSVDHMLRAIFFPSIAKGVASGKWGAHFLANRIVMPVIPDPRITVPDFVDLVILASVDDMLRFVLFPSIATRIASGCWSARQRPNRIVTPLTAFTP